MDLLKLKLLQYTVRDINMENGGTCLNDYLEITFSNREPQKICGRRPPRRPISGAGPSTIKFVSNANVEMRGFQVQYQGKIMNNAFLKYTLFFLDQAELVIKNQTLY